MKDYSSTNEFEFQRDRTVRNKNLITDEEQKRFYFSTIGIAGLSVGSNIATSIVLSGGGKYLRLADKDILELSNLNRVVASVNDIGKLKTKIVADHLLNLNPFSKISTFNDGLTRDNIEKFISGLDIMVDEVDDMAIKYLIRRHCKKARIPLISACDNGDWAVIDVERYDKKPQPAFFHGRLGRLTYRKLIHISRFETGRLISKLMGDAPERMRNSLYQVKKKELVSWPQLGTTAMLNGVAVAYIIRRILNNQKTVDNRAIIALDKLL